MAPERDPTSSTDPESGESARPRTRRLGSDAVPTQEEPVSSAAKETAPTHADGPAASIRQEERHERDEASRLTPGDTVGRYIVIIRLGGGAMGVVYAAYDPELDRKVALKLMHPSLMESGRFEEFKLRLLREAQAMARLSHPHVISVHDAGTFGEQVFVAMDLVERAITLRQWLRLEPRSWRQIREMYLMAGRGLAAAHRAGLIHRDFKPDNVLVGADGRVCVTDFGLARPAREVDAADRVSTANEPATQSSTDESVPSVPITRDGGSRSTAMDVPMTAAGAVLGTPGYMALEQLLEPESVDARADQFGFCAALWEAFYGRRPYDGATFAQLARAIAKGDLQPIVRDPGVPPRVRRMLLKGLSPKADERFPTMDALLADLSRDPELTRRRWMVRTVAATAVIAIAAVSAFGIAERKERLCRGGEKEIAAVWNPSAGAVIHAAFLRSNKPYAEDAWRSVSGALGGFASHWAEQHGEACRATRLRKEQSEQMLDLRMACLQRLKRQAETLVTVFSQADVGTVENAVKAVNDLPAPALCADVQALLSRVPPPEPAKKGHVEELRGQLSEARALMSAGKDARALEQLQRISAAANDVGYLPLIAESLALRGQMEMLQSGQYAHADETLQQAVIAAEQGRHEEAAARAWTQLVSLEGAKLARPADGLRAAGHAHALLQAFGGQPQLESELLAFEGAVFAAKGEFAQALPKYQAALQLAERAFAADSPQVAAAASNVGYAYLELGQWDQALALQERALASLEKTFGVRHPKLIPPLARIGNVFLRQGRSEDALKYHRRAQSIAEGAYPGEHPQVVIATANVGSTLVQMHRYADGRVELQRALELSERLYGADNLHVVEILQPLSTCLEGLRRYDEAEREIVRALAIVKKQLGTENARYAGLLYLQGRLQLLESQPAKALAPLQQALGLQERLLGNASAELARTYTRIGEAQVALSHAERAIPALERAIALFKGADAASDEMGRAKMALAMSLWTRKPDRARAQALMTEAERAFAQEREEPDRAKAAHWLAAHVR